MKVAARRSMAGQPVKKANLSPTSQSNTTRGNLMPETRSPRRWVPRPNPQAAAMRKAANAEGGEAAAAAEVDAAMAAQTRVKTDGVKPAALAVIADRSAGLSRVFR